MNKSLETCGKDIVIFTRGQKDNIKYNKLLETCGQQRDIFTPDQKYNKYRTGNKSIPHRPKENKSLETSMDRK